MKAENFLKNIKRGEMRDRQSAALLMQGEVKLKQVRLLLSPPRNSRYERTERRAFYGGAFSLSVQSDRQY